MNIIVKKIRKAKFFTIIADETTDCSISEQLSICVRYFDLDTLEIHEDFLKFVEVEDLTGQNISNHIIEALKSLNLDIKFCRGQAYDGGANMSGKVKGVQNYIRNIQPLAFFTHCTSHRLNLALSTACSVSSIRNAVGVISSVATFFHESSRRKHLLESELRDVLEKEKQSTIKKMCETRWVERHEAVLTFLDIMPCLSVVLEKMANNGDKKATTAFSLLQAISSAEFIISLVILADILGITLPLSQSLQNVKVDIISAMEQIERTTACIRKKRENSVTTFNNLFKNAECLASEIGAQITVRRVIQHQSNKSNNQIQSVEEYYRISVFIPFLDYIINEMSTRFPKSAMENIGKIQKLLSNKFNDENILDVLQGALVYKDDLPHFAALKGELELWQQIRADMPRSASEAYKQASTLPNIRTLLQLLCTFPVTTSTAERSFSCLRLLKTYLRSKMSEERLNGLALMHIHQNILSDINVQEIIDIFTLKHKRKLKFKNL